MNNFEQRYKMLNDAQKAAVDAIDGPLMVVAGPGTGKTELLSVRVANILARTDALPQNILCLTFTESGVRAMRDRLTSLIGNDANKVAIHTFHAFGSEIISSHGEYFYEGAQFEPANDVSSYEVLSPILEKLPSRSLLSSQINGAYTYLSEIKTAIGQLKKGGLTPEEFEKILDTNKAFIEYSAEAIDDVFSQTVTKKRFDDVERLIHKLRDYQDESVDIFNYHSLRDIIADSLTQALDEAKVIDKTSPITEWKRAYIRKDGKNRAILKASHQHPKLKELVSIYRAYLKGMEERELFDFDDMILRVVHALEMHDELRLQLQETYQYILVDEFQDTNDVQMRLLWNLTNAPVFEGRPNIMVVGDDDQAIYRFQGANVSNVLDFTHTYKDPTIVTLTENYRSANNILTLSRNVITQADDRLESVLPQLDKTLHSNYQPSQPSVQQDVYDTPVAMRVSLSNQLYKNYTKDPTTTQAVIARNHRQLKKLLPHLQQLGLPIKYEHDENILDSEPIQQLVLLANIVTLLSEQRIDEAEALLPELLSHPAWGISPKQLWTVSITAYRNQSSWIEVLLERQDTLKLIAEWLLNAVSVSHYEPLEYTLDFLFGSNESYTPNDDHDESEPFSNEIDETYTSPLRHYFFPSELLDTKPAQYITHLNNIRTLRETIRAYKPGQQLRLKDFIDCIAIHEELGVSIRSSSEIHQDDSAVTLLTAHKAKGLEFDRVYILDGCEEVWGSRARSRSSKLSFPENLTLQPSGETSDERLRLLYVALTRAKSHLTILTSKENDAEKTQSPIGALIDAGITSQESTPLQAQEEINAITYDWRKIHFDTSVATKQQLLSPLLEKYRLSATHLNNFIDITKGGPQQFLLSNLLHFPQAMHPSAAYGSAIHKTLQLAHQHLSSTKELKPIEDVLGDFTRQLSGYRLSNDSFESLLDRGQASLTAFLEAKYNSFTTSQQVEHAFSHESITVGSARLTGAIDLIDIDHESKTIKVTDYKTGKSFASWKATTDFDKIKLHKYEQQLMFYKLLIENSRYYHGYTVTSAALSFVEPDVQGDIVTLEYEYSDESLSVFVQLIEAVWQNIMALDFDITEEYGEKYVDVKKFESHLLENIDVSNY